MKKRFAVIVALVALTLYLPFWPCGDKAVAAEINYLRYGGYNVGDFWTYEYVTPTGMSDFTVTLTQIASGDFAGKYSLGDFVLPKRTGRIIFDLDASGINVYENIGEGVFDPPGKIPAFLPLNEMFVNPTRIEDQYWYIQQLSSLTVPAGTFGDVLVSICLDSKYDPNGANSYFGLDPAIVPHAVTQVEWRAAGFGLIQNVDIDSQSGDLVYLYQLKATSVPLPPSLVLLGSGLLGLLAFRKRFS